MLRAFCREWDGEGPLPDLDPAEAHHLTRVRRVRAGEAIEVLNGRGAVAACTVAEVGPKSLHLDVGDIRHHPEPVLRSHLLVALPKGKTFPTLLQKATELGACAITPLLTRHSEVPPERAGKKSERWDTVLMEAVKQSGNPWMPKLHPVVRLEDALKGIAPEGLRLCGALQEDACPLGDLLVESPVLSGEVEIFIGPEGDFSGEEYALLRQSGCRFVSLGPVVLRVETAASLLLGSLMVWSRRS